MTDLNAVLETVPVGDIAKKLGIPQDVADAAVKQVLPGLIGGMAANASTSAGSAALQKALGSHTTTPKSVDEIDTNDGAKIVKHVFGDNTDQVAAKLADAHPAPNVTMDIIKQVLPIVAPIVLSYIATQVLAPKSAAPATKKAAPASSGGIDLGGMLGGLLSDPNTQQMVGGLLSGLLGGGKK
ncbi:MAG TPA: DUF937 domain-containing protein [Pseudolysinimonas sp.]|nr:DUF937 domain-containing protein [Pseudolysinimonas sp.]